MFRYESMSLRVLVLASLVICLGLQANQTLTAEQRQVQLERDHNHGMRMLQEARQMIKSAAMSVESAFQRIANNIASYLDQARGHASQAHAAAVRHDHPTVEQHHHMLMKNISNAEVGVRKLHKHSSERKRRLVARKLHTAKEDFQAAHRAAQEQA